jgi:hypothetical protein
MNFVIGRGKLVALETALTNLTKALMLLAVVAIGGIMAPAAAQEPTPASGAAPVAGAARLEAVRTEQPPTIDGELNEAVWEETEPSTGFTQRDPQEGAPASERTEVRVLYDNTQIYFGIVCYDSNPSGIRATELRRDNGLGNDDIFEIILDTFYDRRNGYLFRINPLGTQYDATVTNEGQITNRNWDEKWDSQARITDIGWTAEIAIPFKTLRFLRAEADEEIIWGVNFHRTIKSKNEEVFWTAYNRDFDFEEVSRAGRLEGLAGIEGFRFRLKPYFRTGGSKEFNDDTGLFQTDHLTDAGIEVAKFVITSQLTLDFTVNPDFAQADVDEAQVNLTRFPLFFPERREFFQEGAGIFEVGGGNDFGGPEVLLFHSRRIGLSDSRQEIPIFGGAKLTGKQGAFDIGVLNMQTDRFEETPDEAFAGQNFSVLRVKRNVLARSYIGGIFTRNTEGAVGPYNVTGGLDAGFTFFQNLNLSAFVAKTDSRGLSGDGVAGKVGIEWDSDRFGFGINHTSIQENFLPPMGFVPRPDIKSSEVEVSYSPRPNIPHVRQLDFSASQDYLTTQAGALEERGVDASFGVEFNSGDDIEIRFDRSFERLREEFDIEGGTIIPPGDYKTNEIQVSFEAYDGRAISGDVEVAVGDFYSGRQTSIDLSPQFLITSNLSIDPSYEWNRITMPNGVRFSTHEFNGSVNYAFNRRWLTRTTVQLNSQDREWLFNFRLNYIFRPGDDIFVVYNEGRNYGSGITNRLQDRAFIVKFTYSLDR